MPLNLCDLYFRYYKLCNILNIPKQKSLSVLNNKNHIMLSRDNLRYFIGKNLLDDIILDEKIEKYEPSFRKSIHGSDERRITTDDHFINIFNLSISGMKGIFIL